LPRLIQDKKARLVDKRARQRGPLRHATGQLVRIGTGELRKSDELQGLIDSRAVAAQQALRFEPKCDVAAHGAPRIKRWILEHDDARRVRPADRLAVDEQPPGARFVEPGHDPQQRRLTAAARAEQGDELAGRGFEADILQYR
jgi:hypothetical protein